MRGQNLAGSILPGVSVHLVALTSINSLLAPPRSLRSQVRYDMRGHGRSSMPTSLDGYASDLYAADFSAVMDEYKVRRPILIGW